MIFPRHFQYLSFTKKFDLSAYVKTYACLARFYCFASKTSVSFTVAIQRRKRATVARSGNRAFADGWEPTS